LDAAAGLAAGALGGLLFVLLRRLFSPTFSQPGTLSRVLSLPELGSVPQPESRLGMSTALGHTATGAVPFSTNDDSAQSESYRAIRSSLLYQTGDSLLRCLVFTSATAGEGKTTVASNLSMSLAATNRRVLLVDGDMRRPNLHKIFGVSPGPGLSDLLRRDRLLATAGNAQFILQTAIPNLYLLPCGTAGGDAPELLAGDRLPQLLKEMRKNFDLVLIDTPPVLPCADARSFAKAADGVILIVRANETDRREAGVARDTLLQDGSPVIGTVLTGFQARRGAYGYNGYSALPK
jgi:capsular exopolysaccharide synthesis family protein